MMHPTCDARQLVGSAFPHHRPMIDDSELVGGDGRADGAKTMDNRRRVRDAGRRGTGQKTGTWNAVVPSHCVRVHKPTIAGLFGVGIDNQQAHSACKKKNP